MMHNVEDLYPILTTGRYKSDRTKAGVYLSQMSLRILNIKKATIRLKISLKSQMEVGLDQ